MTSASIIVTSYNYERFLRETIESALAQTYPDTEVIVVDDGSSDHSREIISSFGDQIIPVLSYLRARYRCVADNDCLVVFNLHS